MRTRKRTLEQTGVTKTYYPPLKKGPPTQVSMEMVEVTRPTAASALANQAKRTGGWANPSKGGELKFTDVAVGGDPNVGASTFSAGTLLNGLVPGSAATERIGRKVTIKSFYLRFSWRLAATSVGGSPLRILVVYDKQANAVIPGIADILLADDFNSPNNLSNRDRFITISDYITPPVSVQGEFAIAGTIFKNLNLETVFNTGTAGTVGDITTGSIYLFVAQVGSITIATGDFFARSRIRYTDL
jgi:hypothetical protein